MAETSTIFGFMKYVSATDILSDFKKTVDSYFVNSLGGTLCASFAYHKERYNMWDIDLSFLQESAQIFLDEFV